MIKNNCPVCSILQNGWESGSLLESNFDLSVFKIINKSESGITYLYQCPQCNTYFIRQVSQEWDSYNEKIIEIEKINPLNNDQYETFINPTIPDPPYREISNPGHCSKCHSANIQKLREVKVGNNYLLWCKCLNCENEEFMDLYESSEFDE
ncbi:MAG TPA: hypothetical protein PK079_05365 [Leptospiraceae bacterium]|nr:hypothetical protein [Leptospiraceae bacterium]HMW05078.1 hypothetical protein [Leptospiraceae bacterium]HMX34007.1 hypothetical protein [Leptospiraceae bacterium]HMY31625.1 hypothetical protein [Leptospiraceae bacterium]HMZ62631.1 hypothetical protein [Leptospiraceae bacterium]